MAVTVDLEKPAPTDISCHHQGPCALCGTKQQRTIIHLRKRVCSAMFISSLVSYVSSVLVARGSHRQWLLFRRDWTRCWTITVRNTPLRAAGDLPGVHRHGAPPRPRGGAALRQLLGRCGLCGDRGRQPRRERRQDRRLCPTVLRRALPLLRALRGRPQGGRVDVFLEGPDRALRLYQACLMNATAHTTQAVANIYH